ncbi:MAG TPA: 5-oxoprolinase subunit PxpA [Chryseosolibacter sp.]|nr:5-oxoprolinase subunit PxpA [Chryseosolibacter sp.]
MHSVDLNCDMGESFGPFVIGQDAALMDYVSSANIACGFHAGDPSVMNATVQLAVKKNVAIGAHPGYHDLQGFGRRELRLSAREVYEIIVYQVGALMAFASSAGAKLNHVKPHGALYNSAAKDSTIADAIAAAIAGVDRTLLLVGLSGSEMIAAGRRAGLRTASEVFADRTYQNDGSLTSRLESNAMIENPQTAANQVLQMVSRKTVTTTQGKEIPVIADTVCIHGDGKHALDFAQAIVAVLNKNNVTIKKP